MKNIIVQLFTLGLVFLGVMFNSTGKASLPAKNRIGLSLLTIPVFRIGDINSSGSPQGHCTAFYLPATSRIYTAAHCYHGRDFKALDHSGQSIVTLSGARVQFTESEVGLLDILVIDRLSKKQIHIIRNHIPKTPLFAKKLQHQTVGFPAYFGEDDITYLTCFPQFKHSGRFRLRLEKAMGVKNLTCRFDNKLEVDVNHQTLKGLSGGPVLYPNGKVGVAFHMSKESDTGLETMKSISIDQIQNCLSPLLAQRKYQISRNLFEQVKVPNAVRIKIDGYLMGQPESMGKFMGEILTTKIYDDRDVSFYFEDGSSLAVSLENLPIIVQKAFALLDIRSE